MHLDGQTSYKMHTRRYDEARQTSTWRPIPLCQLVLWDLVVVPELFLQLNVAPDHSLFLGIDGPNPLIPFKLIHQSLYRQLKGKTHRRPSSEEQ